MKRFAFLAGAVLPATLSFASFASAHEIRQVGSNGYVLVPDSSIERPQDIGIRAHTNIQLFVPFGVDSSQPPPGAETPASLACIYKLVPRLGGCRIDQTTENPTGGSGVVAIVDAFDNPFAEQDLAAFSSQFGLPACTTANGCFKQVYARGSQPANDPGGWSLEIALDIEMAHAFAPDAKILLVEAKDNTNAEILFAEDLAAGMVAQGGGGTLSNSWSGSEGPTELSADSHFQVPGVVYFASTGDSGAPVGYPAASPFVVAAGGTTILRSGGDFTGEAGWNGSGGGPSAFEPRPAYQDGIQRIVGTKRGTPDFSAVANPATGVAAYDEDGNIFWFQVGGTSVSSPLLAGIVNADAHHAASTMDELTHVYRGAKAHYTQQWRDETSGNNGFPAMKHWDFVTGIGSPLTAAGK